MQVKEMSALNVAWTSKVCFIVRRPENQGRMLNGVQEKAILLSMAQFLDRKSSLQTGVRLFVAQRFNKTC